MDSILRMERIVKTFPGVVAVDDVSFDLNRGEIHALLGHNGAGKSTLVKIISGAYARDAGEMHLDGQPVDFKSPAEALRAGIHMVYQELDLIPQLSGAENIYLGQGRFHNRFGLIDYRRRLNAARKLIERMEVEIDLDCPVGSLSVSKQQIIAIAKAISSLARVIIFDEPTSALNDNETGKLFKIMRILAQDGVGLVLITHRLDEVFQIADRVTVMRDGLVVLSNPVGRVTKADIIRQMTGTAAAHRSDERSPNRHSETVLVCNSISEPGRYQDIHFELRRGEVLGLTGLMGSGALEAARAIYGADPRAQGTVLVDGAPVRSANAPDAARKGLAFVSDDRKRDGLVLSAGVRNNITLAILNRLARRGFIDRARESAEAQRMIERLDIRVAGADQICGTLSGGNQQKVVLSRWLLKNSRVMILCEPTRGIDVVTKNEIYRMIRGFAEEGMGVLVVSSEIDEILETCDRVLVLYEGKLFGEIDSRPFDRAKILSWMYGVDPQ